LLIIGCLGCLQLPVHRKSKVGETAASAAAAAPVDKDGDALMKPEVRRICGAHSLLRGMLQRPRENKKKPGAQADTSGADSHATAPAHCHETRQAAQLTDPAKKRKEHPSDPAGEPQEATRPKKKGKH